MMQNILSIFLGLIQGGIVLPIAFYIGFLVRKVFLQHYPKWNTLGNITAFIMMISWIGMSYFAADALLDIIAGSADLRLKIGRLWVISTFFGLVIFSIVRVIYYKFKFHES